MAAVITPIYKWTVKGTSEFISIIQVTGDTAYPNTGSTVGTPITAGSFGFNTFADTSDVSQSTPAIGYWNIGNVAPAAAAGGFTKIDGTTAKLRFFGSTGTEITNGSDASGIIAVLMAFGH